jgi:HAD superfamily hydrolase (TIGR01490 family)
MELALFDLDNTLLAGDSDFEWGQFLIGNGIVDRAEFEARNLQFYQDYQRGELDIFAFLDFQLRPLAAHPRAQLDLWHQAFMDQTVRPMITAAGRAQVQQHLRDGAIVAIVTATNSFVTGPIARELGVQHLIATVPAQTNGQFTGKPRGTPSFREGKIERVESWLESLGLCWQSFQRSWFYSDSHNDLPLMQRVTDPVAIDPDPKLSAIATEHGWAQRSFRGA